MSAGIKAGIPPRRMKFDVEKIDPQGYYGKDKAMTVFWNTLSMLFPEGEQFFVESIRKYRSQIEDQNLQNAISGFIGQEAFHTLAHNDFNVKLKEKGYPVEAVNKTLGSALTFLRTKNPMLALHVTAILEHYTSSMAIQLLDDHYHNGAVKEEARKLWIHHAIEEYEHRSVSFDVLKKVGGDHSDEVRMALFLPVSVVFAAVAAALFAYNLAAQRVPLKDLRSVFKLVKVLSGNGDRLSDWFKKGFHPIEHQSVGYELAKKELAV